MTAEERKQVQSLIIDICTPSSFKYRVDSHTFKMCIEELSNTCIEHQEFVNIMLELGFPPILLKGCYNSYHFRLKVKNLPCIPKEFRGRGYQAYKYKDG